MTNPFDREDGTFLVLVNEAGQHSLWPAQVSVPDGWTTRFGPALRTDCLELIEREWIEIGPTRGPCSKTAP